MMRSPDQVAQRELAGELDLRALGAAIKRRRGIILLPAFIAFVLISIFVNVVTPRYTAQSSVLLENQETFFTRPDRSNLTSEQTVALDQEAVASQVQLIGSRDLARRAIKRLNLIGNAEFDPLAGGINPLGQVMILLGISSDPTRQSIESRVVTKFLEKLVVYSPPKTRVITIEFTSRDPDLSARAANVVAQLYLEEQSAAKRDTARASAEALAAQITDLRGKLLAADDAREAYRLKSDLLAGSNNMTISGQQLADINGDLSKARSTQADAQAKASTIRRLLKDGRATEVADILNNDTVRRISDQRVSAQAMLARESRTLLPQHPRIKELAAQLAEYDVALKAAAKQAAATLENEATISGDRVVNLETMLNQQKRMAGVANSDEVHLRALERVAQSYKDQLDSSTTKYQEALARQSSTATPADARVISSAARPQDPSFPKKLPFVMFGTIAALVFGFGWVVASELLSGRALVEREDDRSAPQSVVVLPAKLVAEREERGEPAKTHDEPDDAIVFAPVPDRAVRRRSPLVQPGPNRLATTLAYLKAFGRPAKPFINGEILVAPTFAEPPQPGSTTDAPMAASPSEEVRDEVAVGDLVASAPVDRVAADLAAASIDVAALTDLVVAAHVPGRGLHIVGTMFGQENPSDTLIDLARGLSAKGRAIIVDLNRAPARLAPLVGAVDGGAKIIAMHGLAELLSGQATFAEVIHKDESSRLHFIPTGLQEADFHDFDLILDALSETYDFVVMMTPAYPQAEIAKVMAPYADFVVIVADRSVENSDLATFEAEMTQAGAREVHVTQAGTVSRRRDVA